VSFTSSSRNLFAHFLQPNNNTFLTLAWFPPSCFAPAIAAAADIIAVQETTSFSQSLQYHLGDCRHCYLLLHSVKKESCHRPSNKINILCSDPTSKSNQIKSIMWRFLWCLFALWIRCASSVAATSASSSVEEYEHQPRLRAVSVVIVSI
jgi:hypothetical protein